LSDYWNRNLEKVVVEDNNFDPLSNGYSVTVCRVMCELIYFGGRFERKQWI